MEASDIQAINERFGIAGQVNFGVGPGGLIAAEVSNGAAKGCVSLAGAHVTSYQPGEQPDVFWMSPLSPTVVGKAQRGGIPICWPWFGPHPVEPGAKPAHGFARTALWQVAGTQALHEGATRVSFRLTSTPDTIRLWPHPFELLYEVTFGRSLEAALIVRNPGPEPFQYTAALHHYFQVSDVRQVTIRGLEGVDYADKTEQSARRREQGPVKISAWTDRIYVDTAGDCVIEDPGYRRRIRVSKEGSGATVVWNPMEKVHTFADIPEGSHLNFVCVETANADQDIITVPANDERRLIARISVE